MATPPEQRRFDARRPSSFCRLNFCLLQLNSQKISRADPAPRRLLIMSADTVLENLPNDLTRMIYLASLRDCNSGMYLHPELSQQRGIQAADGAFGPAMNRYFAAC